MRLVAFAAIVATAGCVPVPAHYRSAPAVKGVVSVEGVRANGLTVAYAKDPADTTCKKAASSSTVDHEGRFVLSKQESFFYFYPILQLPADYGQDIRLCFSNSVGETSSWTGMVMAGPVESIKSVEISCQLKDAATKCDIGNYEW